MAKQASNQTMIIIGITGTPGSGKGTVVKYLVENFGFRHFSASGFISEELTRRDLPKTRENMRIVANELRSTHSPSYIAENLYDQAMRAGGNAVLESLRAVGEIESLRKKPGKFFLLAIDADQRLRYDRIIERKSTKDFISFEKFKEDEDAENNDSDPAEMNLTACIQMADAVIQNNEDISALLQSVDKFVKPLLKTPLS